MNDVRLTVHVQPRAKRNEVVGFDEAGRLRVRVTAPPTGGAANEAVIALLAEALGIPRRRVTLERGETSRTKVMRIEGIRREEVGEKLTKG